MCDAFSIRKVLMNMSKELEKDKKPSKLKKKVLDAWDDFKTDFAETKQNFRRNVLGINDGDIPGEPKINKTTIKIWICYLINLIAGVFGAVIGYGFVRDSLQRYIMRESNSFVKPTENMWFGLLTVWDVMLALLVAAILIAIVEMILYIFLIRKMDYSHDIASTGVAISPFIFVLFFVIFWIFNVPVPSIM